MLIVQCMKSPGGKCPVRVKVRDHMLNVTYHELLVGQDGSTNFAGMVTPYS